MLMIMCTGPARLPMIEVCVREQTKPHRQQVSQFAVAEEHALIPLPRVHHRAQTQHQVEKVRVDGAGFGGAFAGHFCA